MKLTLIADVHGNLPALEAVLRHARAQGASQTILNLGDLTGYGPYPEEVVRWSRSPQIISILGDYDKKVLSDKQRKTGWRRVKTADKRYMFSWTYQALSKRSRKYLRALPESRLIELEGVKIHMTHGSPGSPQDYVGADTSRERLVALAAMSDASVVLSGHTHQAFSRKVEGVLFINPGTVGRPDDGDPRASYAILEIEKGKLEVAHFRVPYNIMASVQGLRQVGLPEVFTQVVRLGLNYNDIVAAFKGSSEPPVLEPSGTVTLLTDFGLKDHFVGVMKGVISNIAPHANLIDISHQVRPQSIVEGARLLAQAVPYFPPGTVHVAVVDPGVGTERRALAVQIGDHFFVAPDNGLLTLLLEKAEGAGETKKLISLTKPGYWLPQISTSFHGRDIFSPVGAHLANGLPLNKLGEEIDDPRLLKLAQPLATQNGWKAEVVMVDGFGNICTNLLGSALPEDKENITIKIAETTIRGLTQAFGDAKPGTLIALVDSTGHLAVAEVNGNAAERLNVHVGTPVLIEVS